MKEVRDLFIKTKNGLIVNPKIADEIVFLVTEDNIVERGEYLSLFGYGGILVYKNKPQNNLMHAELTLSTKFDSLPSMIKLNEKNPKLIELHYGPGSYFFISKNELDEKDPQIPVIRDSGNVENFYRKFLGGKMSSCVSYLNQIKVVNNALDLNQNLDKVPFIFNEMLVAETTIDKNGNPYRLSMRGEPIYISLKQKTALGDTFSSLTFQDAKTSMVIALTKPEGEVKTDIEYYSTM